MQGVVWSKDLISAVKGLKSGQSNLDSVFKNFTLSKKEILELERKHQQDVTVQKQVGTMSYWI